MMLTASDLKYLHERACEAAERAGSLIRQYRAADVAVEHKAGGDSAAAQVVTEVDRQCQSLILEVLAPTLRQFDLARLSEEEDDDRQRLHKDYFWCIDPLDGTLAFTQQKAGYAVSIALVSRSGEPVLGVVCDPIKHIIYSAIQGQGAYRNHVPWHPLRGAAMEDSACLTLPLDQSFCAREDYSEILRELKAQAKKAGFTALNLLHHGGAVMNVIRVLEQAPGLYFKMPKPTLGGGSVWDFAATACVVQEAGGTVCDFKGRSLNLNRADTSFMNDCGVVYVSHQKQRDLLGFLGFGRG